MGILLKQFLGWLSGYVRVMIWGAQPERLVNLASLQGITLWDLVVAHGSTSPSPALVALLPASQFRLLRPLARRCRCRVRIEVKAGLPFIWGRAVSRPGLVTGTVVAITLIVLLSSTVLFVEVKGVSAGHRPEIVALLHEAGLHPGVLKPAFDRQRAEEAVTGRLPYVSWTRISYQGVLARVEVAEREIPAPSTEPEVPADVVAAKDGQLVYFLPLMGVAQVREGQHVRAGQVLISGTIPGRQLGEGKTGAPRLVTARGICLAQVKYVADAYVPCQQVVMQPTGRMAQGWVVWLGGKEIVWRGKPPFDNYQQTETRAASWGRNGKPVVEVIRTSYRELEPVTFVLGPQEAAEKAREEALEKARALEPPGGERESVLSETQVTEQGASARVTITVIEDIARVVPLAARGR